MSSVKSVTFPVEDRPLGRKRRCEADFQQSPPPQKTREVLADFWQIPAVDLLSLTRDQLAAELERFDHPRYRAAQLCAWIYERRAKRFEEMTNLPPALRAQLAASHALRPLTKIRETGSMDTTRKFLFQLQDGQLIETVLIPASPALYGEPSDRRTVCISSQVGCAYGCKFCASGLDGVKRNLTAGEIVAQFLAVEELSGEKIDNIVFMGMGEPCANYRNLMQAIGDSQCSLGLGGGRQEYRRWQQAGSFRASSKLADYPVQIRLAISLHAATDEVRGQNHAGQPKVSAARANRCLPILLLA